MLYLNTGLYNTGEVYYRVIYTNCIYVYFLYVIITDKRQKDYVCVSKNVKGTKCCSANLSEGDFVWIPYSG